MALVLAVGRQVDHSFPHTCYVGCLDLLFHCSPFELAEWSVNASQITVCLTLLGQIGVHQTIHEDQDSSPLCHGISPF